MGDDTRTVRVYRVELLIVDHDGVEADDVIFLLEESRYPNRAIRPYVMDIEGREVEWGDNHPLNNRRTHADAFRKLFSDDLSERIAELERELAEEKLKGLRAQQIQLEKEARGS